MQKKNQNKYNKKSNKRQSTKVMATVSNSGGLRVIKRATTGGNIAVGLNPSIGFVVSGLTSSNVLGFWFMQSGFAIYNPTVGPGTFYSVNYNGYGNYAAMFDQFRISSVKVTGWCSNNTSSTTTTNTNIPLLYSAVDFDVDTSPPTSISSIVSYTNSCVHQANTLGKPAFTRTLVPRASLSSATGTNAVIAPAGSWIDTSSGSTPHYGMFLALDSQTGTNVIEGYLTLIAEIQFEYRGERA